MVLSLISRISVRRLMWLALVIGNVIPGAPHSRAADADPAAPIRAAAEQFVAAFNRGDAAAVAALFTVEGTLVDETGAVFEGQQAIQDQYAALFAERPGAQLELSIQSIRFVTPQLAVEDGVAHLRLPGLARGSAGRYTAVHVQQTAGWRMAAVREAPVEFGSPEGLADLDWLVGTWNVELGGRQVQFSFEWIADQSFLEGQHHVQEWDRVLASGKQIIGWDAAAGTLAMWVFHSDGGYASGHARPHADGWSFELTGVTGDGAPTRAVNILARRGDDLVWQSVERWLGGQVLPDTAEAVLKKQSAAP